MAGEVSWWRRLVGLTDQQIREAWQDQLARSEPIQIRFRRLHWLPVALADLVIIGFVGAAWVATSDSTPLVVVLLVFGPFGYVALRRILTTQPPVEMDRDGVLVRRFRQRIPWDVIVGARVAFERGNVRHCRIKVDPGWAAENLSDLPLARRLWLRVVTRGRLDRLSCPSGLAVSPVVIAAWIISDPYR